MMERTVLAVLRGRGSSVQARRNMFVRRGLDRQAVCDMRMGSGGTGEVAIFGSVPAVLLVLRGVLQGVFVILDRVLAGRFRFA